MKIIAAFLLLMSTCAFAAEPKVVPIWPGAAPGTESWNLPPESYKPVPGGPGRFVRDITTPTLTVYLPEPSIASGAAVVVCAGGGFNNLAIDHEGYEVAEWLAKHGIAGFVLKYRVLPTSQWENVDPAEAQKHRREVIPFAIADGQQAIKFVRSHAAEYGVDPQRIGILGFSAGGYLTAGVALQHDAASRPNFAAPIYPAAPPDLTVPTDAPPLFIVHGDEDKLVDPAKNSVRLYDAWKKAGISAELHIYSKTGHGFGMWKTGLPTDAWIERFREWLDGQGLLKKADAKAAPASK